MDFSTDFSSLRDSAWPLCRRFLSDGRDEDEEEKYDKNLIKMDGV